MQMTQRRGCLHMGIEVQANPSCFCTDRKRGGGRRSTVWRNPESKVHSLDGNAERRNHVWSLTSHCIMFAEIVSVWDGQLEQRTWVREIMDEKSHSSKSDLSVFSNPNRATKRQSCISPWDFSMLFACCVDFSNAGVSVSSNQTIEKFTVTNPYLH